jgi:hypothetical protein
MRENSIQAALFRHNAMPDPYTKAIGKQEDQLSDGMFACSLDHGYMCDGASQPSTAELALGPKNTHRKYCFHGPGANSVRLVLQNTAILNGNAH